MCKSERTNAVCSEESQIATTLFTLSKPDLAAIELGPDTPEQIARRPFGLHMEDKPIAPRVHKFGSAAILISIVQMSALAFSLA